MKNKYWIIILIALVALGLVIYFLFNNSNQSNIKTGDYNANRTEASINTNNTEKNDSSNNIETDDTNNSKDSDNDNSANNTNNAESNEENVQPKTPPIETQIATFSTKIYTKDPNRQNNINITCNTLNDTLVENGATFSFCGTVGQATTARGYKKAEIFDAKRK